MTARRPRALFLAQALPYPPDGGVKIRTYHVLRALSKDFDVTALCFYRRKRDREGADGDVGARLEGLRDLARVEAFPLPQEGSRFRLGWDHLRSAATGRVYTTYSYESDAFRSRLDELLRHERFDLVHADSLDLSRYFGRVRGLPLVCVHHDVQSKLLRRRSHQEGNRVVRGYLRHQARLMRREERRWCPRVSLNVTVSDVDRRELESAVGGGSYEVVPNGVDVDRFRPAEDGGSERELVFVGGTTWFPNRDALAYYSQEILPLLTRRVPGVRTAWVGRASTAEKERYGAMDGLRLTGYVEDIRPHVHRAGCYVVPLRVGGGTRLKILDAWAMGKAVVSTSIGCEGLSAVDDCNILIRDDPGGFVEAVRRVLEDGELRDRLGADARRTAVEKYSWDSIGRRMLSRYRELLPGAGG